MTGYRSGIGIPGDATGDVIASPVRTISSQVIASVRATTLGFTEDQSPDNSAWLVSLMFWLSLLLASVLYAAVALSPKLAEWNHVRQQYAQNAFRLVQLEEQIDYLERVSKTLRSDSQYARRLLESRPGGVSLPVSLDEDLRGPRRESAVHRQPAAAQSVAIPTQQTFFADTVVRLARNPVYRRNLLVAAAVLTLLSFTFLNDSAGSGVQTAGRCLLWLVMAPLHRYRPQSKPDDRHLPARNGTSSLYSNDQGRNPLADPGRDEATESEVAL